MKSEKEILARILFLQEDAYTHAKDRSRKQEERNWFHGYADGLHDLETWIRKVGPFAEIEVEKK